MKKFPLSMLLLVFVSSGLVAEEIEFTPIQTQLFSDPGGQSNAWGDFDNDGDLDLIITFRDAPVRPISLIGVSFAYQRFVVRQKPEGR